LGKAIQLAESYNEQLDSWRHGTPPKDDTPSAGRRGYVYFIRVGARMKIGFSHKPLARVADLLTGMSHPPSMIVAIRAQAADEYSVHQRFAALRQSGEWFTETREMTRFVMRCVAFDTVTQPRSEEQTHDESRNTLRLSSSDENAQYE